MTKFMKVCNIFYDFFCLFITIFDILSDILITIEFYESGRMTYFCISFIILLIVQASYSFLFLATFADHKRHNQGILWFFFIFPVAQLVPIIIWIESFHLPWFTKILKYFQLSHDINLRNINKNLIQDVRDKVQSFNGFFLHSFVESVPQCILQIIALATIGFNPVSNLQVISLLLSLISIGSKAVLVCYSINWSLFWFHFSCYLADIFAIFCLISWLFLPVPSNIPSLSTLNQIWYMKELIGITAILILCVMKLLLYIMIQCSEGTFLKITYFLIVFLGIILAIPLLCLAEGVKFCLFPIIGHFTTFGRHSIQTTYWTAVFDFIYSRGKYSTYNEMSREKVIDNQATRLRKIRIANQIAAAKQKSMYLYDEDFIKNSSYHLATIIEQACLVLQFSDDTFSMAKLREVTASTWKDYLYQYRTALYWNSLVNSTAPSSKIIIQFETIIQYYEMWLWPILLLSQFYSLFYPMLCFYVTPLESIPTLQYTLSMILFTIYIVLLIMGLWSLNFRYIDFHLHTFQYLDLMPSSENQVELMQAEFIKRHNSDTAAITIHIANQRINYGSELRDSIDNIIPIILEFSELERNKKQLKTVAAFTKSNTFANLCFDELSTDYSYPSLAMSRKKIK